jgi:hypothetical protein
MQTGPRNRAPRRFCVEFSTKAKHAVHEELDRTGVQAGGVDDVYAVEGVDLEPVVRGLRVQDRSLGRGLSPPQRPRRLDWLIRVVAVGRVDDDAVGLAVASSAARECRRVEFTLCPGSSWSLTVTKVGAGEGVEVDPAPTPAVSIVMLPWVRKNSRRLPFAAVDLLCAGGAVRHRRDRPGPRRRRSRRPDPRRTCRRRRP